MQDEVLFSTLDAVGDAAIRVDSSCAVIALNRSAERLIGATVAELKGRSLPSLLGAAGTEQPSPSAFVKRAISAPRPEAIPPHLSLARPDGSRIAVTGVVVPDRLHNGDATGAMVVLRSRPDEPGARTTESEELFRHIVESATDYAIFTLDAAGRVLTWNPGARNLLGYEEGEILGRPGAIIFTEEDRRSGEADRELRTALEQGKAMDERWHVRRDGSRFWASGVLMRLQDEHGGTQGLVKILRDMTPHKREQVSRDFSERLVRQRLAELEAIYHHSPIGLSFLDTELRFVKVNDRLAAMHGFSVQEHLGRSIVEILPDLAPVIEPHYRRVIETADPIEEVEVHARERAWLVSYYPVLDADGDLLGVNTVVQDITERKRTEDALAESERNLRLLTETIPQLIWTGRPDGAIDYCNQRWLAYTGLRLHQVVGDGWMQVLHPDDLENTVAAWHRAVQDEREFNVEQRLRGVNGTYRWFLTRALPLRDPDGRLLHWYGTCTDIEDLKRAESELAEHREHLEDLVAERTDALRQSLEQLRRTERLASLGTLAAGIAHEINNPLNSILLSAEYAREMNEPQEVSSSLETIVREAKRGGRIVRGILKFAKEERTSKTPGDLNEVVRRGAELIRTYLAPESVVIELQLSEGLPPVALNSTEMQQVVGNLVQNAVQAAEGQVRVTISTGMAEDGQVRLTLQDDGPGIPEDQLPMIFDPFFSTRQSSGGTGLGLSICHGIISDHGGTISVHSTVGQGTRFEILLPVAVREVGQI